MKIGRYIVLLSILFGTVGCDQVTKSVAREHLQGQETLSYLGDTLRLVYMENHGAFLGMGSSLPGYARTLIFVVFTTIFLAVILVWLLRTSHVSKLAILASSLIVGGGIGNLIDRIIYNGGVTDFLNIGIGSLRTGIFNVADVWIMAGFFLMVVTPEFREQWRKPSEDEPEASAVGESS